jgi:hypothetical protein
MTLENWSQSIMSIPCIFSLVVSLDHIYVKNKSLLYLYSPLIAIILKSIKCLNNYRHRHWHLCFTCRILYLASRNLFLLVEINIYIKKLKYLPLLSWMFLQSWVNGVPNTDIKSYKFRFLVLPHSFNNCIKDFEADNLVEE